MSGTAILDRAPVDTPAFAALRDQPFMLLTTFRKSGKAVGTGVWFAEDNGRLYVVTDASSGKVKRLRHTPRVQVTSWTPWRGARGPAVQAQARILPEPEHAHAQSLLQRKYGLLFTIFRWCTRANEHTYLEIRAFA